MEGQDGARPLASRGRADTRWTFNRRKLDVPRGQRVPSLEKQGLPGGPPETPQYV